MVLMGKRLRASHGSILRLVQATTLCGAIAFAPAKANAADAGADRAGAGRFVVLYGETDDAGLLRQARWVVLDADHHPSLQGLEPGRTMSFGYLSLGEVDSKRTHYQDAQAARLLLDQNPNWPGSFYVDLRRPAWRTMVLDRLAPAVLKQGFQGLFLDTLDDAAFLERRDPRRYAGMTKAAEDLVRALHARYPAVPLLLNRAYELHDGLAADLYAVLGESVITDYDFARRRYRKQSVADATWQLDKLRALRARHPGLLTFTLDYWNPADTAGVRQLYAAQRAEGNIPYVSTIDLQTIVPEPAADGGAR